MHKQDRTSHIVTNVVGNDTGVARIILRDVFLNLADKVGTDISSLGVDAATNAAKERDGGATQSVTRDSLKHTHPVVMDTVYGAEGKKGDV